MLAAILEDKPGTGYKVLHRAGYEHLAWSGQGRHSRPDVHGDPTDLRIHDFALTRVKSRAHVKPNASHSFADRTGAPDGASRPVEAGEEAVAGRIDLAAGEPHKLPPNHCVMLLNKVTPTTVAQLGQLRRRADDVREQDGRQNPVVLDRVPFAPIPDGPRETLDLSRDLLRVDEEGVILAGELHQL